MKIKIDHALKIIEKYGHDDVPVILLSDVRVPGSSYHITQGMKFEKEHFDMLKGSPVNEIDVVYSEKLNAKLITNFPAVYKTPIGRKNVIEMDKVIDALEASNYLSKRKRVIISLTEIYKKTPLGNYETVLHYGEKLHVKQWNELKYNIGRNSTIDYHYDECGIIVFFILNAGDPQYAQKFMKFTELVSIIVESCNLGFSISPDLNPETDVYTVNDSAQLLTQYISTKATLIVLGEEISDEYKAALNQVKTYDRYARMIMVRNVDSSNKLAVLEQIKKGYNTSLWET